MEIASTNSETSAHAYAGKMQFSAFQPIEVKPVIGRNWITNGVDNVNYSRYDDAYDDSPTNASIINAFVNYMFGEGLIAKNGKDISSVVSQEDVLLMCTDYKKYGGYSYQVVWSKALTILKVEYIPTGSLGVNYSSETYEVDGYWYSWDWTMRAKYRPKLYPKFTGEYKGNPIEMLTVRRPTSLPFFPVPDYFSGIPYTSVEGQLANAGKYHFENSMSVMTIINYNNGKIIDINDAKEQADRVREKACGTNHQGGVLVSFNDGAEESIVVDQLHPPELNQQNVFYSEEAERKIIVAHSAPPILFSSTGTGSGFSSNADEIEVQTKGLYRRHINPMRKVFLRGLELALKTPLDFEDFKEETELVEESAPQLLDDKTLEAQASLKGSVGGVQALLEIQSSYAQGLTTN